MLADAGGEDERVEAAEGRRHRRDRLGDRGSVDVEREPRLVRRVARLERRDIVSAGEADETGLVLERLIQLVQGDAVAKEVEQRPRVDGAGAACPSARPRAA